MNDNPDATTVLLFRKRLRKAKVIEELFEIFEIYLRDQDKSLLRWMACQPKAHSA